LSAVAPEPQATARWSVETGLFTHKPALHALKQALWAQHEVEYRIADERGWLGGVIYVELRGPESAVKRMLAALHRWVEEVGSS